VNNPKKKATKNKDLGEELVDVVLCLANQTRIDLQAAFDKKMDLKSVRDKDRHKNNDKLK
jgi:NTP pyrophosphatase (non-canonical NTP hydrolase)